MMTERFDAIVIGSGAGGAPVAATLARSGARVLVLEKGPRYRRQDFLRDEIEVCRRNYWAPFPDDDPHVVVPHPGAAAQPTAEGWIAQCVGGGTVHMSGFFFRFHPVDFRMRSACPELTGTTIQDWPFGYDELAPYYDRVERDVGISGDLSANPFTPRKPGPFPQPPVPVHPISRWIDDAAGDLGLHSFHVPRAILTSAKGDRGSCLYRSACGSYGCDSGAKGSTLETYIPMAEATGRCEVRPDVMVEQIEMLRSGRARGVVYRNEQGEAIRVEGDLVVVACGAIESARLLLMSRTESFPDGLGNRNAQVGRNLCLSSLGHLAGELHYQDLDEERRAVLSDPSPFVGRAVQDFYQLEQPIQGLTKAGTFHFLWAHENPIHRAEKLIDGPDGGLVYGPDLMGALQRRFVQSKSLEVEVFSEWLPTDGGFVELDPERTDRWGLPAARIHVDQHPASVEACTQLVAHAESVLTALGCRSVDRLAVAGTTWVLQGGTCRMGTDPETSVTGPDGRVHGIENLVVSDGGSLPSNGGVPNTWTILANALRIADGLTGKPSA